MARTRHSEVSTAFRNPDKGWLPYSFRPITRPLLAVPGGPATVDVTAYASSIYTNYICWTDLEPTEGAFDWSGIDALLNAWPTRKLRLGFASPNEPTRFGFEPYPAWLRAATTFDYYDSASPTMLMPDFRDATFQTKFTNLMTGFWTRYYDTSLGAGENNWMTRIPTIDICVFGRWGEWHSTNYTLWASDSERNSTCNTLAGIYYTTCDAVRGANARPEFSMNVIGDSAYPGEPYDPVGAYNTITSRGASMIRRAIGITPTNVTSQERAVIASKIRTVPMEGEWGSFDGSISWFRQASDPNGTIYYAWQAIDQALELGCSHLGWYKSTDILNCAIIDPDVSTAEVPEAASCTSHGGGTAGTISGLTPLSRVYPGTTETLHAYAQRRLGYRFYVSYQHHPDSVAAGGTLRLTQRWFQRGVAKLYRQHYIGARLVGATTVSIGRDTSSFTAHNWETGAIGPRLTVSSFTVPGGTATGTYELQFAIVDGAGDPAMNIASNSKDTTGLADPVNDYGWYSVGLIRVT
jgi:hypothetical protein